MEHNALLVPVVLLPRKMDAVGATCCDSLLGISEDFLSLPCSLNNITRLLFSPRVHHALPRAERDDLTLVVVFSRVIGEEFHYKRVVRAHHVAHNLGVKPVATPTVQRVGGSVVFQVSDKRQELVFIVHHAAHAVVKLMIVAADEAHVLEHGDTALLLVNIQCVRVVCAEHVPARVVVPGFGPKLLVILDVFSCCFTLDTAHVLLRLPRVGLIGKAHELLRPRREELREHAFKPQHSSVFFTAKDPFHEAFEEHVLPYAFLVAEEKHNDRRHVRWFNEHLAEPRH